MRGLLLLALTLPLIGLGRNKNMQLVDTSQQGISFERILNWKQVRAKAEKEGKFIFIDCYTTWCGPCRQMDQNVYTAANVGAVYNEKFISVKMQMDTGKYDDETVKALYSDAHDILNKYHIDGYPSFLFFTQDGKIISRGEGLKQPDEFIDMANEATDPGKNYYLIFDKFNKGEADILETSWLARQASLLGFTEESREIAKKYLLLLNKDSLLSLSNIQFIREFTHSSKDRGFQIFYNNADSIDRMMRDDIYVEQFLQGLIYQEEVLPKMKKDGKTSQVAPDWKLLTKVISSKYNAYYADRVIIAARSSWASMHNDIPEYNKYLVIYQEKFGSKSANGMMPSVNLNNYAWQIFQTSNKKEELSKALNWSARAVLMYPTDGWMDTYANILYKLGRSKEAIMWEEVALKISPDNKSFLDNLEKMKGGRPTWPNN